MIRYLLVDFDGTLVKESGLQKAWYLKASRQFLKDRVSCFCLLKTAIRIKNKMLKSNGARTIASLTEQKFQDETGLSGRVFQDMTDYCLPTISTNKFSDSILFLEKARQSGVRLVLATNPIFTYRQLCYRLNAHGINPEFFSFITSSDQMHYIKPDVRYYQEILKKLNTGPQHCLMIGNDPKKDLPAKDAGIKVILVKRNRSGKNFSELKLNKEPDMNHLCEKSGQ